MDIVSINSNTIVVEENGVQSLKLSDYQRLGKYKGSFKVGPAECSSHVNLGSVGLTHRSHVHYLLASTSCNQ